MPRSFKAAAMARGVVAPAAWIWRTSGMRLAEKASARASCVVPPLAPAAAKFTGLPSRTPCAFLVASAAWLRSLISARSFSASPWPAVAAGPAPTRPG